MKKMKVIVAVFAVLSMFYNGRAQDVKVEKTDTLGNGRFVKRSRWKSRTPRIYKIW